MHSLKDFKKKCVEALIVTAHPDDESLFIGGMISQFKKWQWTILCVTDCDRRYNKKRQEELEAASRIYKRSGSHVKTFTLGVIKRKKRFSKNEIKKKIGDFIKGHGPFDLVFTHNRKGDYGHKTHKLIHNAVFKLKIKNVYNFYVPIGTKRSKYIDSINLTPESWRIKKKAMDVYLKGSQKTNLSRLKKLLTRILSRRSESFYRANYSNIIDIN